VTASTGIPVDEGIRDLLEGVWSRDMVTEFSCQGGHGEPAHICFARAADATRFAAAHGDLVITFGASRARVDFPHSLIDELTATGVAETR
jgi:hypothetical protein